MKRLTYIDGLKGLCAISICIFHFLLMFKLDGFIGWKCTEEAALDPIGHYFSNFPYSVLINNSFPLYIFFAIIAFLVSYSYLKNNDDEKIKRQAILRYFRFLPIVVISSFITFILLQLNLFSLDEFYKVTNNTWSLGIVEEHSIFEIIINVFFLGFFKRFQLLSPLWCVHYLFLGSMLSYFIMFIFNKIKDKRFLFIFLFIIFFFFDQNYLAFIGGILAAYLVHNKASMKKANGIILIVLGCIFGLFPPVLLPSFINIVTLYAIGACLVLIGTHFGFSNNYFLNNKVTVFFGKESLSLIIVQFIVLQFLNINLYLFLHSLSVNFYLNLLINSIVNCGLSVLLTFVYSKTITPLTNILCKFIDDKIINKNNV